MTPAASVRATTVSAPARANASARAVAGEYGVSSSASVTLTRTAMRLPITTPGSARSCAETDPVASTVAIRLIPIVRIVTPGSIALPGHDGVGQTSPQPLRRHIALIGGVA